MDDVRGILPLPELPPRRIGNGGYDLPPQQTTAEKLVQNYLVGDQPEVRIERAWFTANAWPGQLPNGMDEPAKAAPSDGPA